MKLHNKFLAIILLGVATSACTDNPDIFNMDVDKPETLAQYEYLTQYQELKSYLTGSNHTIGPRFRVGAGVTASEFTAKSLQYRLACANFQEVTFGNAMKYASCVDDNGEMDFSNVNSALEAALDGGLSVYGHTLCWHAQQRKSYLEGLLADRKVEIDPDAAVTVQDSYVDFSTFSEYPYYRMSDLPTINSNGELEITNTSEGKANWEVQYFVVDNPTVTCTVGNDYKLTAMIKGSSDGSLNVNMGDWSGQTSATLEFTNEWQEVTIDLKSVPAESSFVVFQSGAFVGTIQVKWIKVFHSESAGPLTYWEEMVSNGDCEGSDNSSIYAVEGAGLTNCSIVTDPTDPTNRCAKVSIMSNPSTAWDAQFFIKADRPLKSGTKVNVKFRYRCTDERSIDTQAHGQPTAYHHWAFIGTLNTTTSWQDHEYTGTISADQAGTDGCYSIAFNLSSTDNAATFYIDDISWQVEVESSTGGIPLTDEEKYDIVDAQLERWISGMMEACDGRVTSWDVVNEPMTDGWPITVKHAQDGGSDDFFWQDYLGDDYARNAVKYARKYFAEYGGEGKELLLFVNDYNLEAAYNNNAKCEALINQIKEWESDGITKIDGIGSQMHVTYSRNPETQQKNEDCIINMYKLLAASGKLINISELDMGISDEDGNTVLTTDYTFEDKKAMSDFYKFIINNYLEIIPADQQYGIKQWAITDSPAGSGWRAGEPIGLWDENYSRKPAYAGFAEGLAGK
jgi:GH35 family endo-1,4-beta-xylanase